jgi:large subunit ribosomal protein L25
MSTHKLSTEKRKITGRKVKTLRLSGSIPANVFGRGISSYAIQVNVDEFKKVYKEAGETGIVELAVGKAKTAPVLISNVQTHPVSDSLIHIDFKQVDLTRKVSAMVPIELVGEAPAEKTSIGTVVQQLNEVEVEALPTDLLERFEVDISRLDEVDAAVYVKNLKYDKAKVSIDLQSDQIIAIVVPPQKEEEVTPPAEEAPEGEVAPEGEPKEEEEQKAEEERQEKE